MAPEVTPPLPEVLNIACVSGPRGGCIPVGRFGCLLLAADKTTKSIGGSGAVKNYRRGYCRLCLLLNSQRVLEIINGDNRCATAIAA